MPLPHGGKLVDKVAKGERRERLLAEAKAMPKLCISLELAWEAFNIANGIYSPLEGFMPQEDYLTVLHEKRLPNDLPWTIPIILDVGGELDEGETVALTVEGEEPIAIMQVEEIYRYDREELAELVYGTLDVNHPGVRKTMELEDKLAGGEIELLNMPEDPHQRYTLTPLETRVLFKEKGWKTVVGFQTRNIPHLGHEYVQKTALTFFDGLFINPVIGKKKPGDFKDEAILEAYEALMKNYYLKEHAILAVFHTEMRYAGPREAIFHAIIRKNFGCSHFIVGRDHAGVGNYYPPYAAQEIFEEFPDLGITPLFFKSFFYCKKCSCMANEKTCPHDTREHIDFSGTKIREMLKSGTDPPRELIRPEVIEVLKRYSNPFVEG
jgi:sulfate adenylyltransferase